jgi:hypothetical protein
VREVDDLGEGRPGDDASERFAANELERTKSGSNHSRSNPRRPELSLDGVDLHSRLDLVIRVEGHLSVIKGFD